MREIFSVLFPYIVILYIIDCISYVKRHHFVFVSNFRDYFKLINSGLCIKSVSPLSRTFLSRNNPVLFTSSGIYLPTSEQHCQNNFYRSEDFTFIPYHDMDMFEIDGKRVRLNHGNFINTASIRYAKHIGSFIQELKDSKRWERRDKIKAFLDEANDFSQIENHEKSFIIPFFYLKILCAFLFVCIFIILPIGVYADDSVYFNFPIFVLIILLLYLTIIIMSYTMLGKIYPEEFDQRLNTMLSVILMPVAAIHVLSYLTRDIYANFDPLAIGRVLLPRNDFQGLLRKELFYIDQAKTQHDPCGWSEFWGLRQKSVMGLLAKTKIDLSELRLPPDKKDRSAAAYCPLCYAEYRFGFNRCSDCSINLKPYE